jgi:hypothetical protein
MIATQEMVSHYEKVGWSVVADSMIIDQPDGQTKLNYPTMVLPVCKQNWPIGPIDLCGLPW